MKNTKIYSFGLYFNAGSSCMGDLPAMGSISQAPWRARMIPAHRVAIDTYEDPHDPRDRGAAAQRMESVRLYMVDQGVDSSRLEMQVHAGTAGASPTGESARRADVTLFPRVASLTSRPGDPDLNLAEVRCLQRARELALFPDSEMRSFFEERWREIDWMRVVGHPSFDDWAARGAPHPLYEPPQPAGAIAVPTAADLEFAYRARPREVAKLTLGSLACGLVAAVVAGYPSLTQGRFSRFFFYGLAAFLLLCACAGVCQLLWGRHTSRRVVLTDQWLIVPPPPIPVLGSEARIHYQLIDQLRPGLLLGQRVLWVDHAGGPTAIEVGQFDSDASFERFSEALHARAARQRTAANSGRWLHPAKPPANEHTGG
ncbi:hypothetical protein [Piscinibacter koreensis]|uniref:Uncharacterized protein n=1 Tax=Piscinibacter koreensis TaxID=2742824 RepID=A0A7Y6NT48_9BURK|nr:hypothetical protein [Schlegelella koreensis]NUZ08845.1 hypothetical protein [Schlegelella koreensis]